jgi:hypothetical protein
MTSFKTCYSEFLYPLILMKKSNAQEQKDIE